MVETGIFLFIWFIYLFDWSVSSYLNRIQCTAVFGQSKVWCMKHIDWLAPVHPKLVQQSFCFLKFLLFSSPFFSEWTSTCSCYNKGQSSPHLHIVRISFAFWTEMSREMAESRTKTGQRQKHERTLPAAVEGYPHWSPVSLEPLTVSDMRQLCGPNSVFSPHSYKNKAWWGRGTEQGES